MAIEISKALENIDPKAVRQTLQLVVKAAMNPIILGLIAMLYVLIFFGIVDTFIKPQLDALGQLDKQLATVREQHEIKLREKRQFEQWKTQLKGFQTSITELNSGQSPRVVALQESTEHLQKAKQRPLLNLKWDALPAPHDTLKSLGFAGVSDTRVNIVEGDSDETSPIHFQQYNYELTLEGTYAALVNYINQLVASPHLVEITGIELQPASLKQAMRPEMPVMSAALNASNPESAEDALDNSANVPVRMLLKFTIYLYDPANP